MQFDEGAVVNEDDNTDFLDDFNAKADSQYMPVPFVHHNISHKVL